MLDLDTLIPYLRRSIDDIDSEDYDYSDEELRRDLKFGVISLEAEWEQGYTVSEQTVGEGDNAETHFFIDQDIVPDWFQMLIVLKTAYKIKVFVSDHSIRLPSISVTSSSKKDDLDRIEKMIESIEYERRFKTVGFAYSTWDDYFTRYNLILDQLNEGYR